MDKQQVLEFIARQLEAGIITKQEVASLAGESAPAMHYVAGPAPVVATEVNQKNLTRTFYIIGALIAIVGVGILVVQNWEDIGFAGRLLVTLGISLLAYVLALIARGPERQTLSQILFAVSAGLAPIGTYVLLNEAGISFTSGVQSVAGLILAVIFGVALTVSRRHILTIITAMYASWAYYALLVKVFNVDLFDTPNVFKWATMLLGIAYILIGYGYHRAGAAIDARDEKTRKSVQNYFYAFGTLAILGAGISFGGAFDLIFIAFIFAAFYGSVYLKSGAMLGLGALFLMAHIIKLTSKYFVDSIGWPVALIAIGFFVIGVGYLTFYLNRKFVSAA
jgi:hypothetical protein